MNTPTAKRRIVYLFGAGASHASIKARNSVHSILTRDLNPPLLAELRPLVVEEGGPYEGLMPLFNEVMTEDADLEHLITFLDESPSAVHRQFADHLRRCFSRVLTKTLQTVEDELASDRFGLYAMLLDMYNVPNFSESLEGILTINYDDYIEAALSHLTEGEHDPVDYGIDLPSQPGGPELIQILKLHGSFSWHDTWPVRPFAEVENDIPLWIPPGIQKAKERYPFNLLWGRAREMLRCDVLRIVGCRLSPNDWDLIALLFTTRHAEGPGGSPYTVEIIDSPSRAKELKQRYPYLNVISIVEIQEPEIGRQLVGELLGGEPRSLASLSDDDRETLYDKRRGNWFRMWLQQMAEQLRQDLGVTSLKTRSGAFLRLWEEMYG